MVVLAIYIAFWYLGSVSFIIFSLYIIYCACSKLTKGLLDLSSIIVLNFFHHFFHGNDNLCKLFLGIHVSQPHVTFWSLVISITWIGIKYMRTVSLKIALPYSIIASVKPPFSSGWMTYLYSSLTGIYNKFLWKNIFPMFLIYQYL